MRARAAEALARIGSRVSPDTEVRRLSIADRQLVQIARALLVPHRVVIFDEPTAVLTPVEAESLFGVIRRLKEEGVATLYISHRLPEVKAISDRVTVLRDGRLVATRETESLEPIEMARLMVGRDMSKLYPEKPATALPRRGDAGRARRPCRASSPKPPSPCAAARSWGSAASSAPAGRSCSRASSA